MHFSFAGSTINEEFSLVAESVIESSPLGRPTGGFSERMKLKTADAITGSVVADGGAPSGKPGKSSKANNQGIPALVGGNSGAPPADGMLTHFDELPSSNLPDLGSSLLM